jgi:lysophospholipase L1-like esterase
VFERNALRMIERNALILQREGIPAIFLLQPLLLLERDHLARMPQPEKDLFEFNIGWQENLEEYYVRATPLIARRIEETVTPLGASFLDLTGIYGESEGQIFTDYAHLTPEGNEMLAERVAEAIVRKLQPSPTEVPGG